MNPVLKQTIEDIREILEDPETTAENVFALTRVQESFLKAVRDGIVTEEDRCRYVDHAVLDEFYTRYEDVLTWLLETVEGRAYVEERKERNRAIKCTETDLEAG
jgi:hypothetical protein